MKKLLSLLTVFAVLFLCTLVHAKSTPKVVVIPLGSTNGAVDEVRTAISVCGTTISTVGSYYFTDNLDCAAGNGIDIAADNVTIDLMGFTLSGPGSGTGYGIYMYGRSNVEIKNGTVQDFGKSGIVENSSEDGKNHRIVNVRSLSNGGIGIFLGGSMHYIEDCTVSENSTGIYNDQYNMMEPDQPSGVAVINSIISSNSATGLDIGAGGTVTNNTIYNNGTFGLVVGEGSTVINNTVIANGSTGISASDGSTVTGNTVSKNDGNGINIGAYGTVTNNTVSGNDFWGVTLGNGSLLTGNTIAYNNVSNTANQGGIRVSYKSMVKGNAVSDNKQHNIWVNGFGNSLEGNLITTSTNGISFVVDGNLYTGNRTYGNITDYNIGSTTQTDGGGNISF